MNKSHAVIAVINSSDDTVEMLRIYLQQHGYSAVVTAHLSDIKRGTLDVLEFVRHHDPRVLIYDISIPYAENWNALKALMNMEVMRERRFVVTTTNKRALEEIVGHRTDTLEIVGKPYDLEQLVEAVDKALTEVAPRSNGPL